MTQLDLLQEKGKRVRQRWPDRKPLGTDLDVRFEAQDFETLKRAQAKEFLHLADFDRKEIEDVMAYLAKSEEDRKGVPIPAGLTAENIKEIEDRAHAQARRIRDEHKKQEKRLDTEEAKDEYEVSAINRIAQAMLDAEDRRREERGRPPMPDATAERILRELSQQLKRKPGDTEEVAKQKIVQAEQTLRRMADLEAEVAPEREQLERELAEIEGAITKVRAKLKKLDPKKNKEAWEEASSDLGAAQLTQNAIKSQLRDIESRLNRAANSAETTRTRERKPRQRAPRVWSQAEKRAEEEVQRRLDAFRKSVAGDPDRVDPDAPERGIIVYPRELEDIRRDVRNERGLSIPTQGRSPASLASRILSPEEAQREIRRRVEAKLDQELARHRAEAKAKGFDPKPGIARITSREHLTQVTEEVTDKVSREQRRAEKLGSGETVLTGVGLKVFIDEKKANRTPEQREQEAEARVRELIWDEFGPVLKAGASRQVDKAYDEKLENALKDVSTATAARRPFADDLAVAREKLEDHRLKHAEKYAERRRLETKLENAQEKDKPTVQSKLDSFVASNKEVWEREDFLADETQKAYEALRPAERRVRDAQKTVADLRQERLGKQRRVKMLGPDALEKAPQAFKDEVEKRAAELRKKVRAEIEAEHEYILKLRNAYDAAGVVEDKIAELASERNRLFAELQDDLGSWAPGSYTQAPDPAVAEKIERFNELDEQLRKLEQAKGLLHDRQEPSRDPSPLIPALTKFLHEVGFNRQPNGSISMDVRGYFDPDNPDAGQGKLGEIKLKLPTHTVSVVDEDAPVYTEEIDVPVFNEDPSELGKDVYKQTQTVAQIKLQDLGNERTALEQAKAQAPKDSEQEKLLDTRLRFVDNEIARLRDVAERLDAPDVAAFYEDWREAARLYGSWSMTPKKDKARLYPPDGAAPISMAEVEEKRLAFRDVYFGEDAEDGEEIFGLIKGGDAAVVGAPAGQKLKTFNPSDGSDLDTGRAIRPVVSRMRGAKPGDSADAYDVVVGDTTKDTPAAGLSPRVRIGTQRKTVQRVPTKEETRLVPLDDAGRGRVEVELTDHNGKPVASMTVDMELDDEGSFRPSAEAARALRTAGGRNAKAALATDVLRNLLRAATDAANPDGQRRWPKGTPWQPKGPGPGRFRPDFDVHVIPAPGGAYEVQATPADTPLDDIQAIRANNPEGVQNPSQVVVQRTGNEDVLGAALAKAAAMAGRGPGRKKTKKKARVFLHGPEGPRHIRDVQGGERSDRIGHAGEFTSLAEAEFEPLSEAFASNLFISAVRKIRQAHSRFQLESLKRLYPDLAGTLFEQRYEIERERDEEFLSRMEARLRQKIEAAVGDPNLSATEKARKSKIALDAERRYFRRHLSEAAWRMARNAEIVRLKEAGEPGAYWLMDNGLKTHTDDCLAMEGKVWPWSVLDVINPANRHPGCGCRLIAENVAISRGLPVKRGKQTVKWREAVGINAHLHEYDDDQPRWPKGHPWGGRWKEIHGDLDKMVDAVRGGDLPTARAIRSDIATYATKAYDAPEAEEILISLGQVLADEQNPEGKRVRQGEGIAHRPEAKTGSSTKGWAKGEFRWNLDGANPVIKRIQGLQDNGDGTFSTDDLAFARTLEIDAPELRRRRVDENGEQVTDLSPLNAHSSERREPIKKKKEATAYSNIDYRQLGDAGEEMFADFVERMKELGRLDEHDNFLSFPSSGGQTAPLDWIVNGFAIEVKATGYRAETPGMDFEGPGIHRSDRVEKLHELEQLNKQRRAEGKEPLRPMLVQVITDLDNDLGHIFAYEYTDAYDESGKVRENVFTGTRIPRATLVELFDGTLAPGDVRAPRFRGNERPTVFVGSFRLRYNPLKRGEPGQHLTQRRSDELQWDDKGDLFPGLQADTGVTPTAIQGNAGPKATQRDKIVQLAIRNLNAEGNANQKGIAKELGINQATVSRTLSPKKADPPAEWVQAKAERAERVKAEKEAKKKAVGRPKGSKNTGDPALRVSVPRELGGGDGQKGRPKNPYLHPDPPMGAYSSDDLEVSPPPPSDEVRKARFLDLGLSETDAELAVIAVANSGMAMDEFIEKITKVIPLPSDSDERTAIKRKLLHAFLEKFQ
jgi:hypothetical protein